MILFGTTAFMHAQDAQDTDTKITLPKYPGGETELYKFIYESVQYPVDARKRGIQGTVFTSFMIDAEGKMQDLQVVRGVDEALDQEALRVIGVMKEKIVWIPGTSNGQHIALPFHLPIRFKLD